MGNKEGGGGRDGGRRGRGVAASVAAGRSSSLLPVLHGNVHCYTEKTPLSKLWSGKFFDLTFSWFQIHII